jgi:hypothetical protein
MNDLLNIELRLLLLRYGRKTVLKALGALHDHTLEEVEAEINLIEQRKPRRKEKAVSAVEFIAQRCRENPESADKLYELAVRYENRAFLPQLKDVQRFLNRTDSSSGRVRSRRQATRQVMAVLCHLNNEELSHLTASHAAEGDSDFALLAREIMGGRERKGHTHD